MPCMLDYTMLLGSHAAASRRGLWQRDMGREPRIPIYWLWISPPEFTQHTCEPQVMYCRSCLDPRICPLRLAPNTVVIRIIVKPRADFPAQYHSGQVAEELGGYLAFHHTNSQLLVPERYVLLRDWHTHQTANWKESAATVSSLCITVLVAGNFRTTTLRAHLLHISEDRRDGLSSCARRRQRLQWSFRHIDPTTVIQTCRFRPRRLAAVLRHQNSHPPLGRTLRSRIQGSGSTKPGPRHLHYLVTLTA